MMIFNRKSQIANRKSLPLLIALVLLAAPALAGEAIYLNSGEEYRGELASIADGKVVCRIAGEEKTFELANIQRIEFQKPRQYDAAAKAADLPDLPVFKAIKPATADLAKRFPQAGYVVLYSSTRVRLQAKGRYTIDRVRAWRMLRERAADTAKRSLLYFPDRQTAAVLYGLTVAPDGSVTRIADSAMKDEALYARQPAYDFRHRLRFSLRGPVPGATFIVATRVTGTASLLEPLVLDTLFHGSEPALHTEVRLIREDGAKGEAATAALNGLAEATDGAWSATNTPQILPEPLMPPGAAFVPRLVLAWPQATWPEIAKAFVRRLGGSARIRREGTPHELYHFLRSQLRIEDVALDSQPDGPARPRDVLRRGYGTATERALLLAALLRGAGLQAETVLVRDRTLGPLVAGVPRLHGLNRAVVRLTDAAGKIVWLQSDDADAGWGELDPAVQDAEGLNLATGEIVHVPVLPPEAGSSRRAVEVDIAPDGSAKVTDTVHLRGEYARSYRDLRHMTEAQTAQWAARYVGRERTGVHLLDFSHTDFAKANREERLTFVYRVPALAERAGTFLLLRLPNAEAPATEVGRSDRQRDLFWGGVEHERVDVAVTAPKGYRVYAVGQGVKAKGDGWAVDAGFTADRAAPGVVRFRDAWDRSILAAPRSAYAAFRDARSRRSRLRGEVIVFVKE